MAYTTINVENFDKIQTFYINKDSVNGSATAMITSVDLYFETKPMNTTGIDSSGYSDPSVSIAICEVNNGIPDLTKVILETMTSVSSKFVNVSSTGTIPTNFKMANPVTVKSNTYYGIVLMPQSTLYTYSENIKGKKLIVNGIVSTDISNGPKIGFLGQLYGRYNNSFATPYTGRSLKFKVNIAKFNSGSDGTIVGNGDGTISGNSSIDTSIPSGTLVNASYTLVNKAYEFFKISGRMGHFTGGEFVYKQTSDAAGTLNIRSGNNIVTGTGTSFSNNHIGLYAVINDGTNEKVLQIVNVANSTQMTLSENYTLNSNAATYKITPVAQMYYTDEVLNELYLSNSNAANATFRFDVNDVLIGSQSRAQATISNINRYPLDALTTDFTISNPSTSSYKVQYAVTKSDNTIGSLQALENQKKINLNYEGYILSRSQEVIETGLYGTAKKSAYANVSFTIVTGGANTYSVPFIDASKLRLISFKNDINSTTKETRYSITDFDTEVEKNGIGTSKYITNKVSFDENKFAEDVLVYLTAYRPAGTNIQVYAKIHNSADKEPFDDKAWTPLVMRSNIDKYSTDDPNNLIEYSYGLPSSPEVDIRLSGTFFTTIGSNIITTTSNQTSYLAQGDLIKLSNPLFPENNEVFMVMSVASNSITVNKNITNTNISGEVKIDKAKYDKAAWNNAANYNVSRYVSESGVEYDYYNTMQFKVVLLADQSFVVPRLSQFQAIGASA